MQNILLLLFLSVLAAGDLLGNYSVEFFDIQIDRDHPEKVYQAFDDFIVKYKRNYKDLTERRLRFNNFVKSYNKVQKLNTESEKAGYDTKFGINKFADLTSSEFKKTLSHVPPPTKTDIPALKIDTFFRLPKTNKTREKRKVSYPDEYDLREAKINGRYVVGPIKNQGSCACCWGFAVTAVMETVNAVNKGKFSSLSDQEVCDCATDGTPGCKGGNLPMGIQYVRQYGLSGDEEYPYDEQRATESKKCRLKSTARVIKPKTVDFVTINPNRAELEIIHVLSQWNVPVAVYFQVGDTFTQYNSGVIVTDDCYNAAEWHAGAIVGYGTTRDRRGRSHDYWIVKNSWDDDWGEDGYVRIKRNIDWCAIEDSPVTGHIES